jgi:hypothetical protein
VDGAVRHFRAHRKLYANRPHSSDNGLLTSGSRGIRQTWEITLGLDVGFTVSYELGLGFDDGSLQLRHLRRISGRKIAARKRF